MISTRKNSPKIGQKNGGYKNPPINGNNNGGLANPVNRWDKRMSSGDDLSVSDRMVVNYENVAPDKTPTTAPRSMSRYV